MATSPGTSVQDEQARTDALSRSGAGTGTATGQAKENASGREDERLAGADKREEPENTSQKADFARVELDEPAGLQAETAAYGPGGTIPAGMVSSPGGFIPLSAVNDPEEALERTLSSNGRNPDTRRLREDEVEQLSGAEARAISAQRGYKPPDLAGTRTQRRFLLEKQAEDPRFKEEKKGVVAKVLGK